MALFTVSAGKRAILNAAPAQAPEKADSHRRRSVRGFGCACKSDCVCECGGCGSDGCGCDCEYDCDCEDDGESRRRRATSRDATNSLVANQAAVPPASRMRVPVCPSQRPRTPVERMIEERVAIGPGGVG